MSQTNISLVALITALTNRGIATDKTVADNNTASLAALALKAPLASPALTGTPTTPTGTAGLSSQQIANNAWVLNEITTAISSAIRVAGDWDASGNLYPSATSGTGVSGAIRKGDQFTISVAGTLGGVLVEAASVVYAKIAAPGQTSTNWVILEHALQQATETLVGTVRFANLGETVNNSTPIATAAVSPMNLWEAFATYSSSIQEITGNWVFDNPISANGGIIAGGQQINNLYNGSNPSDAVALNQIAGLYKGVFQSGVDYQIGDAVTYQGVLYHNVSQNVSVDFYPMAWALDPNSIPIPTGQSRKVLRSDGSFISYQLQPTNDVVGGAGIYTTLALATANSEYGVRKKGQIVTVTDDPTSANNGTYVVNKDLQLTTIPTSQFTMGQFGAYTATKAGAQTVNTLGSGAVGVFSVNLLESTGAERPLTPAEYSVSTGILTISSTAQVAIGDVITGYYYGASATGQVAVQPLGGIFRGPYTAGLIYQQYDSVINPSGALMAASSLISPAPATYSAATWFDPVATKINQEYYTSLTYASSITLDYSLGSAQTLTATGSVTFVSISNKVAGRSLRIFITNTSGIAINVTLPSVWKTQGVIAPSIAANKSGVVTAEFVGTTEAQVWASIVTQQ